MILAELVSTQVIYRTSNLVRGSKYECADRNSRDQLSTLYKKNRSHIGARIEMNTP